MGMKEKNELLSEMEKAMDRYDLKKEIEKAYIGEWIYGVSMVPCDWVYKYVAQPEIVRCKYCVSRDPRDGMCEHVQQIRDPDWFCADGERRNDDG